MFGRRDIALLLLFSFILLFFTSILVSVFFFIRNVEIQDFENDLKHYQYMEKDTLTDESSFGTVSLFAEIEEGSFLYKWDRVHEKHILISHFGSTEYECVGSCYCEEGDLRRISQTNNALVKGMSYLLVAASSAIAFNLARGFYEKECEENLINVCVDPSKIQSKVDSCKKLPEEPEKKKEIEGEKGVFLCKGNCVEQKREMLGSGYSPKKVSRKVSCKNLRLEDEIVIYRNRDLAKSDTSNIDKRMLLKAKERFLNKNLKVFCEKNSFVVYYYEYDVPDYSEKGDLIRERMLVSVCVSINKKTKLKNINCRRKK